MNPKPVRLQRSRRKGSKLVSHNGLPIVCVTRPGKWGNQFRLGGHYKIGQAGMIFGWSWIESFNPSEGYHTITSKAEAVEWFETYCRRFKVKQIREELAGKNLACWCPIGSPCHADVLLRIANEEVADPALQSARAILELPRTESRPCQRREAIRRIRAANKKGGRHHA